MQTLTAETFQQLLETAAIRPRLRREVRFVAGTSEMDADRWAMTELLAVADRSGNKGILVMLGLAQPAGLPAVLGSTADDANRLYVAAYELSRGITSSTGRAQPIICDFCRTWQTGSRSGSITLYRPGRGAGSITFLCCADLQCSRHVRTLTSAAHTSRSQLREDLTNDQRVDRLRRRLEEVAGLLDLRPLPL